MPAPKCIAFANNDYVHIAWDLRSNARPSSEDQPIRKYSWRDVSTKRGETFKYRVVPMESPGKPLAGVAAAETGFVTLTPGPVAHEPYRQLVQEPFDY